MAASKSTSTSTVRKAKIFFRAVEHPFLKATSAASIRTFLRAFDQYAREVQERAHQVFDSELSSEAVIPVHLKFCFDSKWIELLIDLEFLKEVSSYNGLMDDILRKYLEKKSQKSKELVTLDIQDDLVQKKLRINMSNTAAKSRVENLFIA